MTDLEKPDAPAPESAPSYSNGAAIIAISAAVVLALMALSNFSTSTDRVQYNLGGALSSFVWMVIQGGVAFFLFRRFGKAALAVLNTSKPPSAALHPRADIGHRVTDNRGYPLLLKLRERADKFMVFTETQIDRGQLIHEHAVGQAAASGGKFTPAAGALIGMGIANMMKGRNFTIGLLAIEGNELARYEGADKMSEATAHNLIGRGDAGMKPDWRLPLSEVPEMIEVSAAGDHMANVQTDQANRVEEVYFMHRGRRMVVGRFFNLVRDAATIHQYEVREFIINAKREDKARRLGEEQSPSADTSSGIEKGFDL
jgi:hypothetical protein